MKKRLFALVLAACLVLSLVPLPAFAEENAAVMTVQALIDDLPDTVTDENRQTVEDQLDAIDEAKLALTDEERDTLDFAKYDNAIAAINVLDDQPGAEVPGNLDTDDTEKKFWVMLLIPSTWAEKPNCFTTRIFCWERFFRLTWSFLNVY